MRHGGCCSTPCSDKQRRNHRNPALLVLCEGEPPTGGPKLLMWKGFPYHGVIVLIDGKRALIHVMAWCYYYLMRCWPSSMRHNRDGVFICHVILYYQSINLYTVVIIQINYINYGEDTRDKINKQINWRITVPCLCRIELHSNRFQCYSNCCFDWNANRMLFSEVSWESHDLKWITTINSCVYDDVIAWKCFWQCWPFAHRSPMDSFFSQLIST